MVLSQDMTKAVVLITNNYNSNLWDLAETEHKKYCTIPIDDHGFINDSENNKGTTHACEYGNLEEPLREIVVSALLELDPTINNLQFELYEP